MYAIMTPRGISDLLLENKFSTWPVRSITHPKAKRWEEGTCKQLQLLYKEIW